MITLHDLETIGACTLTEPTPLGDIIVSRGHDGHGYHVACDVTIHTARTARRAMYYVERFRRKANAWQVIAPPPPPPKCDLCTRDAAWRHPSGGLRCRECPRPER